MKKCTRTVVAKGMRLLFMATSESVIQKMSVEMLCESKTHGVNLGKTKTAMVGWMRKPCLIERLMSGLKLQSGSKLKLIKI